jgi:DNA-binding HxlR family transcriptional regulator
LAGRKNRGLYAETLRSSRHSVRWSELRDEAGVNDKVLVDILSRLLDVGFLKRENRLYVVADPVVGAVMRLRT